MTPEKARKLLPIVQAIADGKKIQIRSSTTSTWKDASLDVAFILEPECYRIKPQPIERWINLYSDYYNTYGYNSREAADDAADSKRIACIKVTFMEGEGL
jgi:hypothetical protein